MTYDLESYDKYLLREALDCIETLEDTFGDIFSERNFRWDDFQEKIRYILARYDKGKYCRSLNDTDYFHDLTN